MDQVIDLLENGRDAWTALVTGAGFSCLSSFAASYTYEKFRFELGDYSAEKLEERLQETKENSIKHRDNSFTGYKDLIYLGRQKALENIVKEAKRRDKENPYHNQLYWEE